MNHTNQESAAHSDTENDDEQHEDANRPLLSSSSATEPALSKAAKVSLTAAIHIPPFSANRKQSKSYTINNNNGISDNRIIIKLNPVSKLNRLDYRRSYRDKWGRIRLGILTIAFFIIIYLCFSINLTVDKRTPQMVVDIPPMDENLPGPRENTANDLQSPVIPFLSINPQRSTDISTSSSTDSDISINYTRIRFNSSTSSTTLSSSASSSSTTQKYDNQTVPKGFLVWSPGCQMPSMDPLAKDVMRLFHIERYEVCSKSEPLTHIEMNWTTSAATLIINNTSKWYSTFMKSTCCYHEITRLTGGKNIDDKFKLSPCTEFQKSVKLPQTVEFILVKCEVHGKPTYKNTHAIIREKPEIRRRLNEAKTKYQQTRPLSVLMLSIDSISRLNLIRAMPRTAQHLYDNEWFELQGYNKIDDNTYPNLMAILAGYNKTVAFNECDPHTAGKLDKCPFIWSDFKESGYVTAYGEDEASLSTFNYQKTGFQKSPPTDYYLRQYMLAAEKHLHIKRKYALTYCLGYKHSVDHIYDYAMDFATLYKSEPSFGLFWTNTFSHNDINGPSSMDLKIKNYLDVLETRGVLNESMVIFLSDHGIRFGPVRHLVTGWLEERLPFIFIWLPEWFRNEHPEIVQALKINRNRLTNPYDLHMTLKHVLELSQPNRTYSQAVSCPNCQSLFTEVPYNRSCEETGIAAHWCTCAPYKVHDKNDKIVRKATQIVVEHINRELQNHTHDDGKHRLCSELKLKLISYSRKAEYRNTNDPYDDYMIVFELSPNGWFESTVRHKISRDEYEITGSVSRLDSYVTQSKCMKIDYLRKFCYCTGSSNPKNNRNKG